MLTVCLVRTGEICFLIRNDMTKLLATTTLLLTLLVSPLTAKEKKGYFDCRITQSYTVQFTDGVSKEYHGSMHGELGPNVGESIKVEYSIVPNIEPPKISVKSYSVLFWSGFISKFMHIKQRLVIIQQKPIGNGRSGWLANKGK